jgi:hypothetical protein
VASGYLFLLLVAIGGGTAAVRTYEASKHFVEGSVQVETDGTSGAIEDGELVLKLPLKVFNGTDSPSHRSTCGSMPMPVRA